MQLMRSLSSRFASMSVKVEEFRIRKHGANEFAEYKITVWEGSAQYSVWRRWSDLKEAYEALEKEHAKEMKKKQIPAFEAHSMRLGAAHPLTLASANHLGRALTWLGELSEAARLHRATLEVQRRVPGPLGPEHPDTLASASSLGTVLATQGEFPEAARIHRETLEVARRVFGAEHPNTLTSASIVLYMSWSRGWIAGFAIS